MREYKPLYKREESFSAPSKSLGRKGVWRNNNWRGYLSLTLIIVGIGYVVYLFPNKEPYAPESRISKRQALYDEIGEECFDDVCYVISVHQARFNLDQETAYRQVLKDFERVAERAVILKKNARTADEYNSHDRDEAYYPKAMKALRLMAKDRKIKLE